MKYRPVTPHTSIWYMGSSMLLSLVNRIASCILTILVLGWYLGIADVPLTWVYTSILNIVYDVEFLFHAQLFIADILCFHLFVPVIHASTYLQEMILDNDKVTWKDIIAMARKK